MDLAVLPVDFPAAVSAEAAEEAGKIRIKKDKMTGVKIMTETKTVHVICRKNY